MFYTISYDISDDSRRNAVSKILESYGTRVQFSVFECNLTAEQIRELLQKLEAVINTDQDSVRCYPLCNACLENVTRIGGPPITGEATYYVT